jgi:hypothetical protein
VARLAAVSVKGAAVATECLARGTKAALLGQKPLTMGQSLAAGLRAGLQSAQVPVWLNTPLTDLYFGERCRHRRGRHEAPEPRAGQAPGAG